MRNRKQRLQKSFPGEHVSSPKDHKDLQDSREDKKLEKIVKNGVINDEEESKRREPEGPGGELGVRGGRKICGVGVLGVLKVLALVTLVPPFLNYASLQKESHSLRPPGDLQILPQGHKLFMNCSGRGQPVVMMDTPGGFSSDVWSLVQPEIAKFTKVCVYDRSGLGFSESLHSHAQSGNWNDSHGSEDMRKQKQPTTENMVNDFNHLLKIVSNDSAGIILVGGGLGAVNMRFYSRLYENVFGLVLINSFFEDMFSQENKEWTKFWYEHFIPSLQVQQVLATLGITRLGLLTGFIKPHVMMDTHLDNNTKNRLKYLLCNSKHLISGISERYYINESLAQLKILRKVKSFPSNVSVGIISSKIFSSQLMPKLNDFWYKNQELLVKEVFPFSERLFVNGDFHTVYIDNAEVIVRAVRKFVQKFRKSVKKSANI